MLAVESADASTVLATAQLPTTTIDLGNQSESAPEVSINVTASDATHPRLVFGASLPTQYGLLPGQTLPVFVQRVGELARLPGPLADARTQPVLSVMQGEYLVVAGGNTPSAALQTDLYDFGTFAPLGAPPTLPYPPDSMAFVGTLAWVISGATGTYFDFSQNEYASLTAPTGATFDEVAGGQTIVDDTGAQYIVGGTRLTTPSSSVLKIDPNDGSNSAYPYGNTTWITLSTPRLGASAAWVPTYGLVVSGGNQDLSAAGVEVLPPDAGTSTPLAYPADPTAGGGAAMYDATHVLVAGGFTFSGVGEPSTPRILDVQCTTASTSCTTSWPSLPVQLYTAQVFVWGSGQDALIVGDEIDTGITHVYRVNNTSVTEIPTRVPHTNARAVWAPVGTVVIFGGANAIESFTL